MSLKTTAKISLAFAFACGALCARASAEIVEISWQRSEQGDIFTRAAHIAPKKALEICGQINQGVAIHWHYSATAILDYNVHFHVGKEVTLLADLKKTKSANDTLQTPSVQDYCWMWTNPTSHPIALNVTLKK